MSKVNRQPAAVDLFGLEQQTPRTNDPPGADW